MTKTCIPARRFSSGIVMLRLAEASFRQLKIQPYLRLYFIILSRFLSTCEIELCFARVNVYGYCFFRCAGRVAYVAASRVHFDVNCIFAMRARKADVYASRVNVYRGVNGVGGDNFRLWNAETASLP